MKVKTKKPGNDILGTRTGGKQSFTIAPKDDMQRRDITSRTYALRVDTLNVEDRSIEAVIATEARVTVFDWSRWEFIEEILLMSGCRIPEGAQVPMQDTHDRSTVQKQLGSCRDLRIEAKTLVGKNVFSTSPESEHAWTLTREGHLKDNSIGYKVLKPVYIGAGETEIVDGVTYTASSNRDLRIALEWEVKENSVVSIGADRNAKNRNDDLGIKNRKGSTMDFKKWLQARGFDYDKLDEAQRVALKADYDAEQNRAAEDPPAGSGEPNRAAGGGTAGGEPDNPAGGEPNRAAGGGTADAGGEPNRAAAQPNPAEVAAGAIQAERQRVTAIRAEGGEDVPADVIARCIDDGFTIEQSRAEFLKAVREQRPVVGGPAIHVRDVDMRAELVTDALLMRAGHPDIVLANKEDGEQRAEVAERFRDMNLLDACRYAIQLDGKQVPHSRVDTIRAAFSTYTLPTILGAIVNKVMLKGYNQIPATWRKWCSVDSVPDFKNKTSIRLTDVGDLVEVTNGGEVAYSSLAEEYEQYSVSTFAKNIAITRKDIINDDLSAFTKVPQGMGARAGRKPGDLVYTHLLANGNMTDGVALFHATHSNLNTSLPLTAANLATAVTAFAKQTDKDGQPINVEPRYLVVPPDLRFTATELVKSIALIIAGSTDVARGQYNVLSDLQLEVVSEVRMSNANYTGHSTTTWYLAGDPAIVDTLVVAFLNGKQEPTLERFNPGPDVMGIIFRIYHDCGAKSLDHRGMSKNTA